MSEIVAGIPIPDSKLAREAADRLREHGTPLLFAHSLRVFVFGAQPRPTARLRGRPRVALYWGRVSRPRPHPELPDPGSSVLRSMKANAAREGSCGPTGSDEAAASQVWDAIAAHTPPRKFPGTSDSEVALVTGGVEADVLGEGLDEISAEDRASVVAATRGSTSRRGSSRRSRTASRSSRQQPSGP